MKQGNFEICSNDRIAEDVFRMDLHGDCSAVRRPGQFVDLALEGRFLRRPLGVADWSDESMTLIYKTVGEGTREMSRLPAGAVIDALTGLGNGYDLSLCRTHALVIGGGLGVSPLFGAVKRLLEQGKKVDLVMGFNTASDVILEQESRRLGAEVHVATLDGSRGVKGFVTDVFPFLHGGYDVFYTCGPKLMMQAVCGALEIPGQLSMEERMGCGFGICYGCTCHTASGPKRVCADGPVFNKEDMIW